ncbi:hypothetical protein J2X65_002051 [Ancylobacter sp. 3268]|uniref:hypothetical protein n=1 Tax=Ancylobacter sp. 3268 TaxID=2817752 RepID=UPI00285F7768|nr:hypothetical protein [Ancylobacter sp. 3268]MDR6952692.1 hypothetical protein [Ancylobacter sp. 3268]
MRTVQLVFDNVVVNTLLVPDGSLVRLDQVTFPDGSALTAVGDYWEVEGAGIGWIVAGNTLVPPALPPVELAALKATLKAQVDSAAEAERLRYITAGTGQAMTYSAKADEARRLAGDAAPDAANYPLLAAEIGITASDLAGVAAVVLANYQAWLGIGAAIEMARLGAKRAIDEAGNADDARAAADFAWPAPGSEG